VREIYMKVKVKQIVIPLPQFDTHILFYEATTRENKTTKNLPIKAILTTQLFNENIIKKKKKKNLTGRGSVRGGSTLLPLLLCATFST
jgi:hypothetical protein